MSITIPYTYGNFPTYRFYIASAPSSWALEVFPLNFLETSLVDELEGENIFYRRKFNGTLLFGTNSLTTDVFGDVVNRKDDWLYFWDIEQNDPCSKIYLIITKTVEGIPETYWEGYFATNDGKFDIDNCTFEVTPLLDDDYNELIEKGDVEYNILATSAELPEVTTRIDNGVNITYYLRNRYIKDVILYIVNQILHPTTAHTTTLISTFFDDSPNNPITQAINRYNYLTIAQKSDIKRPTSLNPANTGMMSFNQLMKILGCMNLKWDYDGSTDVITVEHISTWPSLPGLDLRSDVSTIATNKYFYLKDRMPKYESFKWMEADYLDFVGQPIWYDSPCVNQDANSNTSEYIVNVTTDIDYIRIYGDTAEIADDGWVLLANEMIAAELWVRKNVGLLDVGIVRNNMDLSWSHLHRAFFKHDRVLMSGYMNDTPTDFYSARKTKQQECSIIYCDAFNPSQYITTELGETYFDSEDAIVSKANIRPTGEINLTLLYGANSVPIVPIPEPTKTIYLWEEAVCGHLFAMLSESADDDLDLVITYHVHDAVGADVCTDTVTWTIPIGVTADDYLVPFCDSIPIGGCWHITVEDYTDAEGHGWTVGHIVREPALSNCLCPGD